MKKFSIAIPILLFFILSAMTYNKKKRIVFFGDSITQMGINAGGYIDLVKKQVAEKGLQQKYDLIGAGVGGNKVYDLYLRMEDDVLAKKPTDVVVYVGINDVWHKTSGIGTDIKKYEQFYAAIIKKLQAKKIHVFLCTPTVIGEKKNNENPQDADLDAYSAVVRKLADTMHCTLIDLRKVFQSYEQENNTENKESGLLTTDRVHLTAAGNKLIAEEMIKALIIP